MRIAEYAVTIVAPEQYSAGLVFCIFKMPKPTVSGYFRADSPRIAAELAKYPNRTFYQSLNPVKSACYARAQHERLVERPKETTSDNDIIGFQWILIDADPVRPSGVSASAEEKEAAHAVARKTMKRLMATGFSEPIVADSGNGYHLLFKVHISTDDRQVVADFLSVLDMWFSTDEAKIDTAVYNPSRITKLYGTIAAKGAHTPERPHRQSCIPSWRNQHRTARFMRHRTIWKTSPSTALNIRFPAPAKGRARTKQKPARMRCWIWRRS